LVPAGKGPVFQQWYVFYILDGESGIFFSAISLPPYHSAGKLHSVCCTVGGFVVEILTLLHKLIRKRLLHFSTPSAENSREKD
jgi:hypothetical protein